MAKTAKSLVAEAAVIVGGLGIGIAAMAVVVLGLGIAEPTGYTARPDLALLGESQRVPATISTSESRLGTRPSDSLTVESRPTPVRLVIAAINVDTTISSVGLEPTSGERATVAVPELSEAGWYTYGSAPGQSGATVLAGHVDLNGLRGVFWSLDMLLGGEIVEVYMSDASIVQYRVMRGTTFSRDALPSEELFRQDGPPALHLITCGGAFNQNLRSYESNLVVTAAPIYTEA